ncbi:MAG: sarcosine oxidase subunit alpha family protein [Rhizomicrobium sp.]
MSGPFRIAGGALLDRTQPLRFSFDGRSYDGFAGDTLASALLANGVRLVARSFKYHRPRGLLTAGSEEPNGLVNLGRSGGTPNARATMVELYDGLTASSQNRFPSLRHDIGALAGLASPFLAAGFYYKTFLWPRRFWRSVYEPLIRQAAGLGTAPASSDPDAYSTRFAHCDLLVVGSGPAGLAAASAAIDRGERVILCEERANFGETLLDDPDASIGGVPADAWREQALRALRAAPQVRLLARTTAFGIFADNMVGLCERLTDHVAHPDPRLPRERLWQVRARRIVLATGAIEQPLVFPNNDRPGVMLAGAARAYVRRWGAAPGTRAVVATASDSAWEAAFDLHRSGITIAVIADLRSQVHETLRTTARRLSIVTQLNARVDRVAGHRQVRAIVVNGRRIPCDLVLTSAGFAPAVHLYSQTGAGLIYDEARHFFLADQRHPGVRCAGACNGSFVLDEIVAEGYEAAAGDVSGPRPARTHGTFALPNIGEARGMAFVDHQSDVTVKDIRLALQEGFRAAEHLKRYTTSGMGADQGKTSNLNALGIAARTLGKPIPAIGLTTFRMPYTPVSFGALAGRARGALFEPLRKTPIDGWAEEHGAAFELLGGWRRAHWFAQPGEDMRSAVRRECRTVRSAVGIFDASTLGKIEVAGPDAAEFLERIYVNTMRKLEPGRCRYGLMLREDGFIFDDGVVGRFAEDRFHVTTTTGGVQGVLAHMEDYRQTEWPELKVWLTSTTEQWAVIAVQGPKARQVIEPFVRDIELSDAAMPHLSCRDGHFLGIPLRLFRVSFTGERGYEINVPAGYGRSVWEKLWTRAAALEGTAYGTEAMRTLRMEKGFLIVGQDTDGSVTPADAGLGRLVGKTKRDFIGKRSLARSGLVAADRKQLVGLATDDPAIVPAEGGQVVDCPAPPLRTHAIGHVTSSCWSETLQRSIAMALVENGRARMGERLYVSGERGFHPVRVAPLPFFDPDGARLHG